MKYLTNGEHQKEKNDLLRLSLALGLFILLFFWLTNILMFVEKMGITPASITVYYLGDENGFKNPVSYVGLLEASHAHLFSYAVLLLLLNHLVTFTRLKKGLKYLLITASSLAGIGDIASGWLIVYIHPNFAFLKLGGFVILETSLAALLIVVVHSVVGRE